MYRLFLLALPLLLCTCDRAQPEGTEVDEVVMRPDSFTYDALNYRDTMVIEIPVDNQPSFEINYAGLRVTNGTEAFQKMVHDSLLNAFTGARNFPQMDADTYRQKIKSYADGVKEEHLEFAWEDSLSWEYPNALNYSDDVAVEAVFNQKGYLSLAISHYLYSGGAHGNYYRQYLNFATPARVLTLGDILTTPIDSAALATRIKARIEPDRLYDPEKDIPVAPEFSVLADGLLFSYSPYYIGPWSAGMPEVKLTWEELAEMGLLNETWREQVATFRTPLKSQ